MTDGEYIELDNACVFVTARGTGEPVLLTLERVQRP
jgi:hypothetical protein